ncbi:MAG: hypothetical protein IJL87_01585 [Clostridia bacterium]|nr:hypothetical protein [Clostridia bacterium]
MNKNIISVIGGDLRQVYLAELIAASGYTVFLAGTENCPYIPDGVFMTDVRSAVKFARSVILPLPATMDGLLVNAPFAEGQIHLNDISPLIKNKKVFAGIAKRLADINAIDYYTDEILLRENALLTAEGAVAQAVEQYPGKLCGSVCLVTGYGRIAKELCKILSALGCKVTVAARSENARADAQKADVTAIDFKELPAIAGQFEIIFNTVPAPVITDKIIPLLLKNCFIADLASAPGGTDFPLARDYGIKALLLPGLPGRFSPLAAAESIWKAVLRSSADI